MMDLSLLKGLGPKRREALSKLDIFSVEDLIAYLPGRYIDLTRVSYLQAVPVNESALFKVRCVSAPAVRYPRRNFSVTTCPIEDLSGHSEAVWFNQPYVAQALNKRGEEVCLYGRVEIKQGKRRLMNPIVIHPEDMMIAPVYRLPASSGISQRVMRQWMRQAIEVCAEKEEDVLDEKFREEHHLVPRAFAVKNVHFPESEEALSEARRRLCFEELLLIQLFIGQNKHRNETAAGQIITLPDDYADRFEKKLPYKLTKAQKQCFAQIKADLASGKAMNRLVQGDVGSGKTVVAFMAMEAAVSFGGQAALMAPTEILACQHFELLKKMYGEQNVACLLGSLPSAEKKRELERIESGEARYIVGTNALIQKQTVYRDLTLIVCDEQHRFGVAQRARFFAKGNSPHTLVMSATPIPRTLSLIVFGDLDLSIINELPPGRQRVSTSVISASREKDMLNYIRGELLSGRQAYFVCPRIEDDEESNLVSAEGLFEKLSEDALKDIPIALLHGQMTPEEKEDAMARFVRGEIKALVSTTVIEVGISVPNATVMVVYGADRFGLSQLHQLRGRVGRGMLKSYCFLLSDTSNDETMERLRVMTATNDGFEIAQRDFELRGPGDYLGKRQSGIAEARFSYALSNTRLLDETKSVLEQEILPEPERFAALAAKAAAFAAVDDSEIAYN